MPLPGSCRWMLPGKSGSRFPLCLSGPLPPSARIRLPFRIPLRRSQMTWCQLGINQGPMGEAAYSWVITLGWLKVGGCCVRHKYVSVHLIILPRLRILKRAGSGSSVTPADLEVRRPGVPKGSRARVDCGRSSPCPLSTIASIRIPPVTRVSGHRFLLRKRVRVGLWLAGISRLIHFPRVRTAVLEHRSKSPCTRCRGAFGQDRDASRSSAGIRCRAILECAQTRFAFTYHGGPVYAICRQRAASSSKNLVFISLLRLTISLISADFLSSRWSACLLWPTHSSAPNIPWVSL